MLGDLPLVSLPFLGFAAQSDIICHSGESGGTIKTQTHYCCRFRLSYLHIHTKDKNTSKNIGMKRNPVSAGETEQKPQRA